MKAACNVCTLPFKGLDLPHIKWGFFQSTGAILGRHPSWCHADGWQWKSNPDLPCARLLRQSLVHGCSNCVQALPRQREGWRFMQIIYNNKNKHIMFSHIKYSYCVVQLTTSEGTGIAFPLLSIETNVKNASTAFSLLAAESSPDCLLKIDSYSTMTSISIDLLLVNVNSPRTVTSEPEHNTIWRTLWQCTSVQVCTVTNTTKQICFLEEN